MATENDSVEALAASLMETPEPTLVDEQEGETVEEDTEAAPDPEAEEVDEADTDPDDEPEEEADDDEETNDEPDDTPEVYKVKVDGEEKEVTLDELKRGYSGQSYIQEKMRENKEAERRILEVAQQLKTEREQFLQFAQQVQQGGVMSEPTPPNAELANTDPVAYMQQRAEYDARKQQYDAQQAELQKQQQAQQTQTQQQRQQYLAEQQRELVNRIPDFGDENKAAELKTQLAKFAVDHGVPEQAVGAISDAATVELLYKAFRYDQAQKAAPKKTAKARKSVKPGAKRSERTSRQREIQKRRDNLRKTRSVDAAVAAILDPDMR